LVIFVREAHENDLAGIRNIREHNVYEIRMYQIHKYLCI